eukprot:9627480-Alexandrium_andersonii.AAC.1
MAQVVPRRWCAGGAELATGLRSCEADAPAAAGAAGDMRVAHALAFPSGRADDSDFLSVSLPLSVDTCWAWSSWSPWGSLGP